MPSNVRSRLLRDHLECFFDMSMKDALVVTGCSRSTLWKYSRMHGVHHWPFELIKRGLSGAGHTWDSVQAARNEALATVAEGTEHAVLVSAARVARMRLSLYEGRKDLLLGVGVTAARTRPRAGRELRARGGESQAQVEKRPSQTEELLSRTEELRSRSEELLSRTKPALAVAVAKRGRKSGKRAKSKFTAKRQAKPSERRCQAPAEAEKKAEETTAARSLGIAEKKGEETTAARSLGIAEKKGEETTARSPGIAEKKAGGVPGKEEPGALTSGSVAYEYFARMCGGRFVCQQESVPLTPPSSPGEVDDGAFDFFDEHAAAREHLYPAAVDDVLFR